MSYDLCVFDPNSVPDSREDFLAWFDKQAEWGEGHSYDDPAVTTPQLQAWFLDMIQTYPALNGPHASDDYDNPKLSDYCVGRSLIHVGFSWDEVANAHNLVATLAKKHGVGFYDTSADDGEVWVPSVNGDYVCIHGTGNSSVKLGEVRVYKLGGEET